MSGIQLRGDGNDQWLVERTFARVADLLDSEGGETRVSAPTAGAPVDELLAHSKLTLSAMHVKGLATHGRLKISVERGALRVRYAPSVLALGVSTWLVGYLAGWVIRDIVQYGIDTRAAANWFFTPARAVLQYTIGAVLAYPLLRWRFTRMCRKALRLSDAAWARYASTAHMWKRASVSVFVCFWPFVERTSWWFTRLNAALHDIAVRGAPVSTLAPLAWLTLQVIVLGIAVFLIDWDQVLFQGPGRLDALWSRRRRRLLPPSTPLR